MKRKILCYLFSLLTLSNLGFTNAVKNSKQTTPPSPTKHSRSKAKKRRPKPRALFPARATPEQIFSVAYQKIIKAQSQRISLQSLLERKHRPSLCPYFGAIPSCPEILKLAYERVNQELMATKIPTSTVTDTTPGSTHENTSFCTMLASTESIYRNKYCHDAYVSYKKFCSRWHEFEVYFNKLVLLTNCKKYFSDEALESSQNVNETIREFMYPSEYLNEVENRFFSQETFDSQIMSEILSKKMSELGFENYILQIMPGERNIYGTPTLNNKSRWVLLYRDYENNWSIADFSLAIKNKLGLTNTANAASIPFFEYMGPLLNFAQYSLWNWHAPFKDVFLYNTVMINFIPGFYEQSDDYLMSDILYLPFDDFVECKLQIEQNEGLPQHLEMIKAWMDAICITPNYKKIELDMESAKTMHEYMINYLVMPDYD